METDELVSTNNDNINQKIIIEDGELKDLIECEGLKIWGQHQSILENQARLHLQTLTESQTKTDVEDGEILSENEINNDEEKSETPGTSFNIDNYFKQQEQLRKNHDCQKQSAAIKRKNVIETSEHTVHKKLKVDKSVEATSSADEITTHSGSDYAPSDQYESGSEFETHKSQKVTVQKKKTKLKSSMLSRDKVKDDSLLSNYQIRLQIYEKEVVQNEEIIKDCKLTGGLKIPGKIWNNLYSYQQAGVKWLWDLHQHQAGGLLGDEMGLGKTVQIIAFLAGLEYSNVKQQRYEGLGPTLIVCPATVVQQWVKHFHFWWPPFRVVLLHQSSNYAGDRIQLLKEANKSKSIIVTTYESVLKVISVLTTLNWNYVILDEGHKIRNPSARITAAVKKLNTPHRLILTGSPMQNNLQELWSLFDFVVPGKLGTLQVFLDHFAGPITQGGYANATPTQETTALLIATTLKEMINPYMLRRTKDEVKDCIFLPSKSEQVLFCSLTDEQKDIYKGYLLSDHIGGIIGRIKPKFGEHQIRAGILVGITALRKICNHPDLYLGEMDDPNKEFDKTEIPDEKKFGYYKRSGKMIVVAALLKIWKRQGHRVLLFTQSRSMVDIFEHFLTQLNYSYLKMDGSTTVASRQNIIDQFNEDSSCFVFLLTTRVGGLGVNLTGANRVIIYDPDWNPATDTQARERAWRIGQMRQVTIYRLVSAGTIEEKMYQRQIWKQLLSNQILMDPQAQRYFKRSDLSELFSLDETSTNTETANIFQSSKIEVKKRKRPRKKLEPDPNIIFSEDKIQAMKNQAQEIAKKISNSTSNNLTENNNQVPKLTPAELRAINRKKNEVKVELDVNKIDDSETNTSFSRALMIAEEKFVEYHTKKIVETCIPEVINVDKTETEEVVKKKKEKPKVKIDNTGVIEGEKVEGLLKRETKKREKEASNNTQDDYVLEKLFSKKGVHTALQHDVIVQGGRKEPNNLRVHYESKLKADLALKAIRKSRINNWRW